MSARAGVYVLLAFNVFFILALATCMSFIPRLTPPDFAAMRSKIESSPSTEDLRPRALHAITAIESADRAIANLHEVAVRLVWINISWAVANSCIVYLLFRRVPLHHDEKA
jgi:hypothetical protein